MKKKKTKKYKYSISVHFIIAFVVVMVITLSLCLVVNKLFIEKFYLNDKQGVLIEAYNELNYADASGKLTDEEFEKELRSLCDRYSLDVLVVDTESQTLRYMGKDANLLKFSLWDHIFSDEVIEDGIDNLEEPIEDKPRDGNLFEKRDIDSRILLKTDDYEISLGTDPRSDSQYVDMWGNLSSGNLFIIRSPFASIRNSVDIANKFLGYIGIGAIVVSIILIVFVSRLVTRPILELADISEKMANLDFEAKYNGKGNNEITLLGNNINKLSMSLEQTISELKTANIELKRDVEKRTEIDEMRKDFISNVSHELKTPISLIQGYAEGLIDGIAESPEDISYYCEVIEDEAGKMNDIVKKLLALNQLEFNDEASEMNRFDIVALILAIISISEILLKKKEITLNFNYSEPIYVWGDEYKVEEIITNYLSNAINHCSYDKKIDILIDEIEDKVRVSVFNTGDCIPKDSIDHVWEKFYKVDKARTRAYGGSGIGLSIVAALCKTMNSQYGVDNLENGVAFWFELDRK